MSGWSAEGEVDESAPPAEQAPRGRGAHRDGDRAGGTGEREHPPILPVGGSAASSVSSAGDVEPTSLSADWSSDASAVCRFAVTAERCGSTQSPSNFRGVISIIITRHSRIRYSSSRVRADGLSTSIGP